MTKGLVAAYSALGFDSCMEFFSGSDILKKLASMSFDVPLGKPLFFLILFRYLSLAALVRWRFEDCAFLQRSPFALVERVGPLLCSFFALGSPPAMQAIGWSCNGSPKARPADGTIIDRQIS